jgi:hypothetical protein
VSGLLSCFIANHASGPGVSHWRAWARDRSCSTRFYSEVDTLSIFYSKFFIFVSVEIRSEASQQGRVGDNFKTSASGPGKPARLYAGLVRYCTNLPSLHNVRKVPKAGQRPCERSQGLSVRPHPILRCICSAVYVGRVSRRRALDSARLRNGPKRSVYQTVYHGMRYCDQTRARRIFGQKQSPLI